MGLLCGKNKFSISVVCFLERLHLKKAVDNRENLYYNRETGKRECARFFLCSNRYVEDGEIFGPREFHADEAFVLNEN